MCLFSVSLESQTGFQSANQKISILNDSLLQSNSHCKCKVAVQNIAAVYFLRVFAKWYENTKDQEKSELHLN